MAKVNCPVCEVGQLHECMEKILVEYNTHSENRDSYYSICDSCGAELATADQLRRNKRDTIKFRKQIDGLLSGSEVSALRNKLGITQVEAARIFGGGPVAFSKYENDDVVQSEAMDKLLRLAGEIPFAFSMLKKHAGLSEIKPTSISDPSGWQTIPHIAKRDAMGRFSHQRHLTLVRKCESEDPLLKRYA